jgi:signal transduction histidine kinase
VSLHERATVLAPGAEPSPPKRERDLLSSVCHDLKAPLASIVMGTGFLRRVLKPEEEAALRVVDAMHRAAEQMNRLIASFADLARLQSHELTLDRRSYGVRAIAQSAFEQMALEANGQKVAASVELDPDLPDFRLSCDRERLLQILRLLTACALRVLPESGTLAARATSAASGGVCFEVVAKRGGPESRRIIAELPRPELAIARGIIELHESQLEVAGDGERLTLSFALAREPAPSP